MPVATAAFPIANQGPSGNRNMVVGCSGPCPRDATISGLTATARAVQSVEPVPRRPETGHVSWKAKSSRAMSGMRMVGALPVITG